MSKPVVTSKKVGIQRFIAEVVTKTAICIVPALIFQSNTVGWTIFGVLFVSQSTIMFAKFFSKKA